MKTFNQFKEEVNKKTFSPIQQFGQNFAKEAEKFANSKEAENLKNDVLNMFIGKGEELLNKGSAKLKNIKNNVK